MKEPYELEVYDGHCVVGVWLPKVAAQNEEVFPREKEAMGKVLEARSLFWNIFPETQARHQLLVNAMGNRNKEESDQVS